ncbi:acyltransferase [Microbacterium telephonicum]|uniref:acyltransferase n=1 Tax=Microbacterium telephonicum TaxID=1714841 RepID=UPI00241119C1|nr:acyltransferase [Microbacterium telephonicum]
MTGDVNFGSEPFLISLGSDVTIADGVRFLTHDGGVRVFRTEIPDLHVYAPIRVGDRVFIGVGAMIMPGVEIGDDVVVGAGSIVTRNIPSNEVWAGVPARRLKSLEEYREGATRKATFWPVGEYGDRWRSHLLAQYGQRGS